MAEGGESGYEADLESNSDWEDEKIQCDDKILNTNTGHKQHFIYPVLNLTVGDPFTQTTVFGSQCEDCPSTWRCDIELEREDNGSVSYKMTNKRTDRRYEELKGAVWVRIQDKTFKNGFFHEQKYQREGMSPGDELTGSCKDAVTAEKMQNLPDNELVLHIYMIVKSCHRDRKRKHESSSSYEHESSPSYEHESSSSYEHESSSSYDTQSDFRGL